MFERLIRDGIRDGSLRSSDAQVATYAILLQCTGVALWFDPRRAARASTQVAELHVELVLGSLGASAELIAEAIEGVARRAVRGGVSAGRADQAPGAARAGDDRGRRARRARRRPAPRSSRRPPTSRTRGHEVVFGPNHRKVHGYLAGTDAERAADLQWALTRARDRHGPHALRRLRRARGCTT